ncbi:MAG: hypothetical protein WBD55_07390 [Dehalococcoidia bacterium]
MTPTVQAAEQAILPPARPGDTDLVIATHGPVHHLSFPAAAERGRRRATDGLKDGENCCLDFVQAGIEEVVGGNPTVSHDSWGAYSPDPSRLHRRRVIP